jgi:hypothetical protein
MLEEAALSYTRKKCTAPSSSGVDFFVLFLDVAIDYNINAYLVARLHHPITCRSSESVEEILLDRHFGLGVARRPSNSRAPEKLVRSHF